jgi:L-aminopeptidase/D-esterase-like protein
MRTGVTVVTSEAALTAGVHVMGGAPGTRETDLLAPDRLVDAVDAVFLSGGSAFGLDAGSGVQSVLAARGRGFRVGSAIVPIVPGAIVFDLLNGGDKAWGADPPYRRLGIAATEAASAAAPLLGSAGAGFGATTANLKGGLGSASQLARTGHMVGALVVVNALGAATVGDGPHFWAAPFEIAGEFGGLGLPPDLSASGADYRTKLDAARVGENTTIAVIATDAALTKAQAARLAVVAHDGFARALWPCHTPYDGDLVFALATGRRALQDGAADLLHIGAAAASAMARAIARGIYEATPAPGDVVPTWQSRFR